MRSEDREWVARVHDLAPWLWALAYPGSTWRNRLALSAWCALMRCHRVAWRAGVRL